MKALMRRARILQVASTTRCARGYAEIDRLARRSTARQRRGFAASGSSKHKNRAASCTGLSILMSPPPEKTPKSMSLESKATAS